jgi:hypothetical protein
VDTIRYDFSTLEHIMFNLKYNPSSSELRKLKDELNKFFKDSTCKEVIYTDNIDKLFFGMTIIPAIDSSEAMKIITSDDRVRVKAYYLELDSKLFTIGLTSEELVAVLLHEVGHIVNNTEPVEDVRKAIDIYLDKNNTSIKLSDAAQYKDILAFAVKDSIRKFSSLFEMDDDEIIADEFVVRCGYAKYLESAYKRILRNSGKLNRDVNNKLIVLQWTLRLYTDVKFKRIRAIRLLQNAKKITASALVNRELNIMIRALNQIDDDILVQESLDIFKQASKMYKDFKYRGMRSLEDDLYELQLRIKNVDVEEEALAILRQINMRLAMIDDYVTTEKLSGSELERWWNLKNKYLLLREELSKKTIYNSKYYGLFVQVPTVKSRFEL